MEKVRTLEREKKEEQYNQYLSFKLGGEYYGLLVNNVREVIEYSQLVHLTRIPMIPDFIRGVINLRGDVIPVIDLFSRFYTQKSEISRRSCIVIIEIENDDEKILLGALIDGVDEVIDISPNQIEKAMDFGSKIRSDFINGIGKVNDKFIILINISMVLDLDELSNFEGFKINL